MRPELCQAEGKLSARTVKLYTAFVNAFRCEKDPRTLKLNRDTGMLKLIACVLMFCDHAGKMIFSDAYVLKAFEWLGDYQFLMPSLNVMRVIGRLAMPMFAYCVAVGCAYTRNVWKYTLRLLLMGILVQPLYQEAMGHVAFRSFDWLHSWYKPGVLYGYYYSKNLNIFFTLGLAALILGLYRSKRYALMGLAAALVYSLSGRIDYGYKAVVLIIGFYALFDRPLASLVWVVSFMFYWAFPNYLVSGNKYGGSSTQIYALFSLPLIYLPLRKRSVRLPKWFFYGFYPFHLILIYLHLMCK